MEPEVAEKPKVDSDEPVKRTRESRSDGDESDEHAGKPKRPRPKLWMPILRSKFLPRPRR